MDIKGNRADHDMTPGNFVSEVQEFRAYCASAAPSAAEKRQAYGLIVQHATMLNPLDRGYEGAGIALKVALCTWLDSLPH